MSRVAGAMPDEEFTQLALDAARLNALDGITGLLVFNGTRFCQTVEGAPTAIESLVLRLRADPRHHDIEIVEDVPIAERRFRSWDMHHLRVPADREMALEMARSRLDVEVDFSARSKIYEIVEHASA